MKLVEILLMLCYLFNEIIKKDILNGGTSMTKKLLGYNVIFILLAPVLYSLIGAASAFEAFISSQADPTGLRGIIAFIAFVVYMLFVFSFNRSNVKANDADDRFWKSYGFTGLTVVLALLLVAGVEILMFVE